MTWRSHNGRRWASFSWSSREKLEGGSCSLVSLPDLEQLGCRAVRGQWAEFVTSLERTHVANAPLTAKQHAEIFAELDAAL